LDFQIFKVGVEQMKKLAVLVLAITVLLVSVGMNHMFAAPGDSSDPVITLSYIESVLMPNVKKW